MRVVLWRGMYKLCGVMWYMLRHFIFNFLSKNKLITLNFFHFSEVLWLLTRILKGAVLTPLGRFHPLDMFSLYIRFNIYASKSITDFWVFETILFKRPLNSASSVDSNYFNMVGLLSYSSSSSISMFYCFRWSICVADLYWAGKGATSTSV